MVNFYVNRIKLGKMTVDDVPERWQYAVIVKMSEE